MGQLIGLLYNPNKKKGGGGEGAVYFFPPLFSAFLKGVHLGKYIFKENFTVKLNIR